MIPTIDDVADIIINNTEKVLRAARETEEAGLSPVDTVPLVIRDIFNSDMAQVAHRAEIATLRLTIGELVGDADEAESLVTAAYRESRRAVAQTLTDLFERIFGRSLDIDGEDTDD